MKNTLLKLLLFALLSVSITACSKYEEGSKFTVLSKKSRMVNHWKTLKITADDLDITEFNLITEVDIRKNGGVTVYSKFFGISTQNEGTWVFNADKSNLLITNEGGDVASYEIIKLKQNELKVKITSDGVLYVHEYVTK